MVYVRFVRAVVAAGHSGNTWDVEMTAVYLWRPALCLLLALHQGPSVRGATRIQFITKSYLGDSFTVDRAMEAGLQVNHNVNGKASEPRHLNTADHDVFDQTVSAVDADGLPVTLRRRYVVATRGEQPIGARLDPKPRVIQGRLVTVSRKSGRLAVTGADGVAPYDTVALQRSLGDDLSLYLPRGAHAVGETWEAPPALRNTFSQDSSGTTVCRFSGIKTVGGSRYAIIDVVVALMGTEVGGWQFTLKGSATIVWSLCLRRVVEFTYQGTTSLNQTTVRGADTIESNIIGTVARQDRITWRRIGGKTAPVRDCGKQVLQPGGK